MSGFTWAPVWACYGNNNRTNTLRIPQVAGASRCAQPTAPATRISERRSCWPRGLEGIENKLDPGDPHMDNMYLKSDEEIAALGVQRPPGTLEEALMRSKPIR